MDYPGGFITKTAPTLNPALGNAAPGVWRLNDVLKNIKAATWPSYDPYFENTTLLLHGNGTNGGQNNTFLDSSTNNFTITRNGNTTQGTFSPFSQTGWSNYFGSGGASYLIANATDTSKFAFGTGDFTIEFWVYAEALTAPDGLVTFYDQRAASTDGVCPTIYYYSGQLLVYVQATNVIYGSSLSLNQWTHIALSRVSGNSRLFVNGVQTGSTYSDSNNYVAPSSNIRIFANCYGGSRSPTGYCSNFRVVKGTGLYSANFTPPTSPLTAITNTQLLTCQSNRFVDNSSNALTVTPYNTYSVQAFSPFAPTAAYSASTVGGSGYFDGTGDYLTVETAAESALNLTGTFTFEFWFYRNATGDIQLFSKGGGQNNWNTTNGIAYQALIETSTFKWQFSIGGGSLVSIDVTAPAISQWVHVAVGRNGTTTRVWVNGSSIGTSTSTPTPPSTRNIIYAAANQTGGNNVNGYMAGLRIVNGTDVYGVSNTSITVPTSPPTNITNTSLLLNFTNAAIIDNTAKNDLETVGNAQISTTQSKFGGASLYFDGTGDYLSAADSPNFYFGSGDWTIEAWLYINTAKNYNGYFGKRQAGNFGLTLQVDSSGNLLISASTTGSSWALAGASLGSGYSTGAWMHVAVTRSGTTITGWRNGTSTGTQTLSGSIFPATGYIATIGSANDTNQEFNGYIDDFRITKGIARYTGNFTPQTSQWQDQ